MPSLKPSTKPLKVLVVNDEALPRLRRVDLLGKAADVAGVLDYPLNPFSDQRFEAAMRRVRRRLDERCAPSAPVAEPVRRDRLVVKSAGATHFVKTTDIDWIEAVGVYVNCTSRQDAAVSLADPSAGPQARSGTFRPHSPLAHRNLESVLRLEPISHGEFDVVLKHGGRNKVSRAFRGQLEKRLGQAL